VARRGVPAARVGVEVEAGEVGALAVHLVELGGWQMSAAELYGLDVQRLASYFLREGGGVRR
jgi:hypothetical protein